MTARRPGLVRRTMRTKSLFVLAWAIVISTLVGVGAVVRVPFIGINTDAANAIARQTDTRGPTVPVALSRSLATLPQVGGRTLPLMITYHNIAPGATGPYSITPEAFAQQMQLLADGGFHTLRAADLAAWVRGGTLPPRSVFISFDDGDVGVWKYADRVLAAHGFTASAFVITSRLSHGTAYMTWPELTRLAHSGRWDIEAHTRAGHGYVPTNAAGAQGEFLVSREWLPARHRQETFDEYRRRVTADLDGCTADLRAHGLPAPTLFAFPFSAATSTEPAITRFVTGEIAGRYAASMLDDGHGGVTTQDDLAHRQLRRLDVLGTDNLADVVKEIARSVPLPLTAGRPLRDIDAWEIGSGSGQWQRKGAGAQLSTSAAGWKQMDYAPTRTLFWQDYSVDTALSGLRGRAAAGVVLHAGSAAEVTAAVSAGWLQLRQGTAKAPVYEGALPAAATHRLRMSVVGAKLTVQVDGLPPISLPAVKGGAGGPGVFISAVGRDTVEVADLVLTPAPVRRPAPAVCGVAPA